MLNTEIPAEDAFRSIQETLRQRWSMQWFGTRDSKLREIKCDTVRWTQRGNTADQRIMTRLRIGHTRLTHTFLLKKESPPICECCGLVLDVRHLLLECRKYETERKKYDIGNSLFDALKNTQEATTRMIDFLRETRLYGKL
jgi:hypothetical protein